MRSIVLFTSFLFLISNALRAQAQTVQDDFEGNGTISTWYGDDCGMDNTYSNPYPQGINSSNTVLKYTDNGGQYANIGFDVSTNFDLSSNSTFRLKIYVPSSGITGNQNNQISLKLQNGTLGSPWSTQCEIIKPILLNQWQSISFDFSKDNYINLDNNSAPPTERADFNRIVLQVNGENNNDHVVAYLDDFMYDGSIQLDPVYDHLVWADEFNGEGAIDATKWFHQTQLPAGGGWYNGEIQHYTNRTDNSSQSNGLLHIVAKKEVFSDQGYTKQYTSARLNSKFAFTYGRIEVKAKLPKGVGTWPAIWMLGKNINEDGAYWDNQGFGTTNWPACGEIDIMEHWGSNQNYVQSAMHTPSSYGSTVNRGGQTISTASSAFHVYALDWYPEKMVFSVDGVVHYTYHPSIKNPDTWPFDADQYLLLNIAIEASIDPAFTQSSMDIDYVRVYQSSLLATSEAKNKISFDLKNAPNPAHFYTNISYELPESTEVALSIYDINGRLIQELVQEKQAKGIHQIRWNTNHLLSGIYFYTLKTKDISITKKCIITK
jgi:beta-glucanase (GH16 family)